MSSPQEPTKSSYTQEARHLIHRAACLYHSKYGLSTTSCQIYDTAWLSMISKISNGKRHWLFEPSFFYLLRTQSHTGSWGDQSNVSQTATLLDTAAALLALIKHSREPLQIPGPSSLELQERIARGTKSLQFQLSTWHDITSTNHIGVEMIIPALLRYLEAEGVELPASYPARKQLEYLNSLKMSKFDPAKLYGPTPSSALHSLEGFIGIIDFDRVSHHLYQGSMLASPSSTAAYLMNASVWDLEAEAYLRHVMLQGSGHGDGGIPGTFPTTNFEYSWPLCTLLENGFDKEDLKGESLNKMVNVLKKSFRDDRGVIGWAPRAIDADDTAKGLLALSLLNDTSSDINADAMIKIFECSSHFRTFITERDPSLSTNCHVLLALLHQPNRARYHSQILKATTFIVDTCWGTDGIVKDKWHLSRHYPMMLVATSLTEILRLLDTNSLSNLIPITLQHRLSIVLFQACHRTLLLQSPDGSWGQMPEQTAYAILTLSTSRNLHFMLPLSSQISSAISAGVSYLQSHDLTSPDQNWTSKTSYRVELVADAYHLAALQTPYFPPSSSHYTIGSSLPIPPPSTKALGFIKLLKKTPLLTGIPDWEVQASLIESSLFTPLLHAQRSTVFERDEKLLAKDEYLDLIPFTWIHCSNAKRKFVAPEILYEMMMVSMLGYQVDEYVESVLYPCFEDDTAGLHGLIDEVIAEVQSEDCGTRERRRDSPLSGSPPSTASVANEGEGRIEDTQACYENGKASISDSNSNDNSTTTADIRSTLTKYITYILRHPLILSSSPSDREALKLELRSFLRAHATQNADNKLLRSAPTLTQDLSSKGLQPPTRPSFFHWVRTTAADHVACAYSFSFLCCLLSSSLFSGRELFPTVREKYLSSALIRHLTTTCRMYNDLGSVERDRVERNLNSLDFAEFENVDGGTTTTTATTIQGADAEADTGAEKESEREKEKKKEALLELARYEDQCYKHALKCLRGGSTLGRGEKGEAGDGGEKRKLNLVEFFCDVTDVYDQVYFVKDLSSRIKVAK